MKIFLLIGMFSLCFIKVSGTVPGDNNDCEKTYTNLIVLHRLNNHSSKKISALIKKVTESENEVDKEKHKAEIELERKRRREIINKVHSDHVDKSCLSGLSSKDLKANLLAYKKHQPSQDRLQAKLKQAEVAIKKSS